MIDCGHVSRDVANAGAQLSAVLPRCHVLASLRLIGPCQPTAPTRSRALPFRLETSMIRLSASADRPAPRGLHQLGLRLLVRLYGPTDDPGEVATPDRRCRGGEQQLTACR